MKDAASMCAILLSMATGVLIGNLVTDGLRSWMARAPAAVTTYATLSPPCTAPGDLFTTGGMTITQPTPGTSNGWTYP